MQEARWSGHGESWPEGHRACTECEDIKPLHDFHKHKQGYKGYNNVCKVCRLPKSKENYKRQSKQYKLWHSAKNRCVKNGREFSIEISDIEIQEICPVLKIPYEQKGQHAPSLDRLDNSKGYTKDNIIVMSRRANRMKGDCTKEDVQKLLDFFIACEIL